MDRKTVEGFGKEWAAFDQSALDPEERGRLFSKYFSCFPLDALSRDAEGFDLGCGSGRWAALVAPRVGILHCIDPATEVLKVAERRLSGFTNVRFHLATADEIPLPDRSQDFGYSLGVLHHVPDTAAALQVCVQKLKPGAPFLLYLYYRFDNRPGWFQSVWRTTDIARRVISRLPFPLRRGLTTAIAASVYFPLAWMGNVLARTGRNVTNFPLSAYRNASFYTMRTDSLDRFGTRLERRFTRSEIRELMESSGLERIVFREAEPYWVACGYRRT